MLALVAGYARHAVVDSDQFANRASAALEAPAVRELISARVADEVLAEEPDLIAVRPLIESVAGGVVGGGAFTGVFRSAVRDVHRALIDRDEDTLTLTLRDIGVVLAGAVQAVRPELADELRRADDVALLTRDAGPVGGDLVRAADRDPAARVAAARRGGGVRRRGARALARPAGDDRRARRRGRGGRARARARLRGRSLRRARVGAGHGAARRRGSRVGRVPRRPARRGVGARRLGRRRRGRGGVAAAPARRGGDRPRRRAHRDRRAHAARAARDCAR